LRVNSAKDDAAGLAIGMDMDKAARAISADIRAQSDVISKNQTIDGALAVLGDMALRIGELVKQQGNTNLTDDQKSYLGKEIKALADASKDIVDDTEFNNKAVLDTLAKTLDTPGGAGTPASPYTFTDTQVNEAIAEIASARADAGAAINTSEFKIQSLRVNYEAQMAAKGRIMDADFAEETSRLARFQILQQAGTAMISQANAVPQNVLSLLR